MNFLFVVTYGRSGSTLLNGILNSISSYKIMGENHSAYSHMMRYYDAMMVGLNSNATCEQNFNTFQETNPWWNDFAEPQLRNNIRNGLINLIDPDYEYNTIGFKEIRFPKEDLDRYLDFLHYIFDCKFLFLTRDLNDVCKSEWHSKDKDCKANLTNFEDNIKKHIKNNPQQKWHHVKYKEIIQEDFSRLFTFLGEKPDIEKLRKVLDTPHSFKTTGEIRTRKNNYLK